MPLILANLSRMLSVLAVPMVATYICYPQIPLPSVQYVGGFSVYADQDVILGTNEESYDGSGAVRVNPPSSSIVVVRMRAAATKKWSQWGRKSIPRASPDGRFEPGSASVVGFKMGPAAGAGKHLRA
jgi:hypothetical protein